MYTCIYMYIHPYECEGFQMCCSIMDIYMYLHIYVYVYICIRLYTYIYIRMNAKVFECADWDCSIMYIYTSVWMQMCGLGLLCYWFEGVRRKHNDDTNISFSKWKIGKIGFQNRFIRGCPKKKTGDRSRTLLKTGTPEIHVRNKSMLIHRHQFWKITKICIPRLVYLNPKP